jgi:hypothetical protein
MRALLFLLQAINNPPSIRKPAAEVRSSLA